MINVLLEMTAPNLGRHIMKSSRNAQGVIICTKYMYQVGLIKQIELSLLAPGWCWPKIRFVWSPGRAFTPRSVAQELKHAVLSLAQILKHWCQIQFSWKFGVQEICQWII